MTVGVKTWKSRRMSPTGKRAPAGVLINLKRKTSSESCGRGGKGASKKVTNFQFNDMGKHKLISSKVPTIPPKA